MPAYYGDDDEHYMQRAAEVLRQTKQRTYELMHIQPGSKVIDVGCGPGLDTVPLAQLVGPTGHVVGIDFNPTFLALADERAAEAGVSAWVMHQHADATSLPFENNSFDACRSERLLQHLHHPAQAVAEMVRITRSGGWIVVMDTDWGTLSIDTPEVDIERRLVRLNTEAHNNGYSGRQLYRQLKRHQFCDIEIEMVPGYFTNYAVFEQMILGAEVADDALAHGVITEEEAHRWKTSLTQAASEGVFFASGSMILVAGRKP